MHADDEECYACMVGVATGPKSHTFNCPARHIPMPEQDGQWGPEWDRYDELVAREKLKRLPEDGGTDG